MIQIQTALINASSFKELRPVIEKAGADVSFWGIRYIEAIGYKGRCSLDALTGRVIELFESRKETQFSKEECEAGIILKGKIDYLYFETDNK